MLTKNRRSHRNVSKANLFSQIKGAEMVCRVVRAGVTITPPKHACIELSPSSFLWSCRAGHCRGLEARKFAGLLGTEGNPPPQLVCMSACKAVWLLNGEIERNPSVFLALIFRVSVLKIGVTSPERTELTERSKVQAEKPENVHFRADICIRATSDKLHICFSVSQIVWL